MGAPPITKGYHFTLSKQQMVDGMDTALKIGDTVKLTGGFYGTGQQIAVTEMTEDPASGNVFVAGTPLPMGHKPGPPNLVIGYGKIQPFYWLHAVPAEPGAALILIDWGLVSPVMVSDVMTALIGQPLHGKRFRLRVDSKTKRRFWWGSRTTLLKILKDLNSVV